MIFHIHSVKPYLEHYGYWAVFFGIFLESFGMPLPGETLLVAGGLFAASGHLNILWITALAFLATCTGNSIGYAIGYFGGRRILLRYGPFVFLNENRLRKFEDFFSKHGGIVVTFARFLEGLRQFNGVIAGTGRMNWMNFLLFNVIGAILWVGVWGSVAYFFGYKHSSVIFFLRHSEKYLLWGAAIFLLVVFFRNVGRWKK